MVLAGVSEASVMVLAGVSGPSVTCRKTEVRISKLNLAWIFKNIQLNLSLFVGFSGNSLLVLARFGKHSSF